jgi:cell division septation protein DedD
MGTADGVDSGTVRNLDQIQEADPSAPPSRLGALVLASLGGACIVLAAALLLRAPVKAKPTQADPLGDLVARTHPAGTKADKPGDLSGQDITFPGMLSDAKSTTALEAVRDPKAASTIGPPGPATLAGADLPFVLPPGAPTAPPPAADRLPVVPLPAQNVIPGGAPIAASDTLTSMAKRVAREDAAEVAAGAAGGHQLQVSSFKTQAEADGFAAALRRRGHHAYVEPAQVKGRGLWYRVRIGPFKQRHAAVIYRQDFEAKERMVTFIVDPPKTPVVKVKPADDDE